MTRDEFGVHTSAYFTDGGWVIEGADDVPNTFADVREPSNPVFDCPFTPQTDDCFSDSPCGR